MQELDVGNKKYPTGTAMDKTIVEAKHEDSAEEHGSLAAVARVHTGPGERSHDHDWLANTYADVSAPSAGVDDCF